MMLLTDLTFSGFADLEVEGLASSLSAGLVCEVATITSGASGCSDWQCHSLNTTIDIVSPTCEIKGFNYTNGCGMQLAPIDCDIEDAWGVGCDSHADGHNKNRLVFMIGQMAQNLNNQDLPTQIITDKTTTILCEPEYNITSTNIRMDRNGNLRNVASNPASQNSSQPFPAWDLVDGLHTSTQAAGLIVDSLYAYSSWESNPWGSFWKMFESWTSAAYPSSNLKDANILQSRANELFSMATAQIAKRSLMQKSANNSLGTCYGTEDRLRVRGLSLYLMGASLILLVLSTILLLYTAPRNYASRDPATIGGLALVLSQSPSLLSRLSHHGSANLEVIKNHLKEIECQSFLSTDDRRWRFSIDWTSKGEAPDTDPASTRPTSSSEITFWRPLSLLPIFKICVIVFLLVLIVILEVVYSVSQKHDGIAEVDTEGYVRFSWVYIPAVVMLTAQTLVGMIAFSSVLVFPYFLLRTRSSSTRNDILRDYVSQTAIESVWRSVANRHLPVLCMALAMLLTPLLTIAVSGLYTPQATSTEIDVTLSLENQLNASFSPNDFPDWSAFAPASANIGLLLTQNFTYPLWTYDELGFPEAKLEIPDTFRANSSTLSGSNITATLPGIRANLNCSIAPDAPRNLSDVLLSTSNVTFTPYEDAGCDPAWPMPGPNPFGFFSAGYGRAGATVGNRFCGAFGLSESEWRAFTCDSLINQLDVAITLDAATLAIFAATPDESSSRLFSTRTLNPDNLGNFPSSMIPSLFGSANFEGATAGYYDPAFQAVIYEAGTTADPDAFPMARYMDAAGFAAIAAHLQHVHRTVVAQSARAIRVPLGPSSSSSSSPHTVNATLRDPHVYRLRQSAVSTRILDALLAAVALCVALSLGLVDARRVLPKNPASIAAGASLVAGGPEMLGRDVVPEGAQWWGDAELEKRVVWGGLFFSLGWWDANGAGGQGRRFGLDVGKAEG